MLEHCPHQLTLRALDVFRVGSSVLAPCRLDTGLTLLQRTLTKCFAKGSFRVKDALQHMQADMDRHSTAQDSTVAEDIRG